MRKLEFADYHSDYNELVIGMEVRSLTGAVMEHLAGLAGEWDLLDLTDLRDEGDRVAAMETAAVSAGLPHRLFFETIGCPYMPMDAPWSETQKKKHLRFARRAFLGLHERAGEGFRLRVVDRPQLEEGLLERMIAVEAQKQVDGRLSKPFIGSYPEVFRSLFDTLGPHGLIAIIVLEKFDRLVAYRFLYVCGTKLWDYQTAYDREYSELSPGTLLISAAIDYGFEHGYDEFNFLRGVDKYKMRWATGIRRNRRMILLEPPLDFADCRAGASSATDSLVDAERCSNVTASALQQPFCAYGTAGTILLCHETSVEQRQGRKMRDTHGMVLNSSYTVELISTVEGIAALENDWNRLIDCAENPNVFMTYGWFYAWTKELANENGRGRLQPYVLSIKQSEAVVGIAPLVLRIAPLRPARAQAGIATHHSDYNELVVGRDVDALTSAAIEYLARSTRDWDLIELEELRDTGHLIAAIRSAAASSGLPCRFFLEADGCPYMPIDGPWAQTQKKKHLNFARRAFLEF